MGDKQVNGRQKDIYCSVKQTLPRYVRSYRVVHFMFIFRGRFVIKKIPVAGRQTHQRDNVSSLAFGLQCQQWPLLLDDQGFLRGC